MHKLLKHQLKKIESTIDKNFLDLVNQTYIDADEDRKLLEHSLAISSEEMRELYTQLEEKSRTQLQESENKYNKLVYELRNHYFFYAYDTHYKLTYLSDSVYNILGYTLKECINQSFTFFLTDDYINKDALEKANNVLNGNKPESYIVNIQHKDGSTRYIEIDSYPSYNKLKNIQQVEGIARDVTERYEAQKKLQYISNHDMLTGIANRHSLYSKLEYLISDSARNKKTFALMYIDLDEFKTVNDTLGHDIGDLLLQEVTKRVKKEIRQNDIFSRIGGDEFVLVLTDVQKEFIAQLATTILDSLSSDFTIDTHTVRVSVSIGISIYPKDGEDIDSLLKNADSAMYTIKKGGKNNFAFF